MLDPERQLVNGLIDGAQAFPGADNLLRRSPARVQVGLLGIAELTFLGVDEAVVQLAAAQLVDREVGGDLEQEGAGVVQRLGLDGVNLRYWFGRGGII